VLGSIEFACNLLGTKLILILGHTHCGAIKAAFDESSPGNIGPMVDKIKKSLGKISHIHDHDEQVRALEIENIMNSIAEVKKDINLNDSLESGRVKVIGAIYNIESGVVDFFE